MRKNSIIASIVFILALMLWAGFVGMVWQLAAERERYATLQSDIATREQEEELGTRLRALVRETNEEREVLDALVQTDILTAVATIEAAGGVAGTDVSIQQVSDPQSAGGNVRTISLVAHAEGGLNALANTLILLETLPFPAVIESVRLGANETSESESGDWQMTVRIRIITTSSLGV